MTNFFKKLFILTFLFSFCSCLTSKDAVAEFENLEQYYKSLDTSCQSDQDCQVSNAANCCGYYPRCLNKNAKPNPEFVKEFCQKNQILSTCGFEDIQSCKCVASQCQSQNAVGNSIRIE